MVRSEFRKIITIRTPWLLLAAGPLIVVAGVSGLAESATLSDSTVQSSALSHTGIAALTILILGILGTAGEYRHGTITDTYLSFPRRQRVVITKLAIYALAGAVAGVASAATALAATVIWWAVRGSSFPLEHASTWRILGGGLAVNIAFAAIGAGLGALIRNVVIAIAVALAWIALIEGIAAQLIGSTLARWLPFTASEALDGVNLSGPGGVLPQWGGGLVLLGYTAAFAAAAVITTLRRDVT